MEVARFSWHNSRQTQQSPSPATKRAVAERREKRGVDGAPPPETKRPPNPQFTMSDENTHDGDDKKKAEAITIRVKDQSGEETFFKVKPNTKMEKIFSAYAQRKGVPAGALRFLLDGTRISGDQTPKMLELEDQDQIDCALEQVGGAAL